MPKTEIFDLFLRFAASGPVPRWPGGPTLKFRAADEYSPGCLKAVWLKMFGPGFLIFKPKIDTGTP